MGWKDHTDTIEEVRKVKWDELWHVIYKIGKGITWDRVNKVTAMRIVYRYL